MKLGIANIPNPPKIYPLLPTIPSTPEAIAAAIHDAINAFFLGSVTP